MTEIKEKIPIIKTFEEIEVGDHFLFNGYLFLKISKENEENVFFFKIKEKMGFNKTTKVVLANVEILYNEIY